MTPYAVADVSQFPRWEEGNRSALWWGTVGLVAITSTVYAALIASYFYLHGSAPMWPEGPIPAPALFWPTLATGVRIASEPCTILANRSARRGNNIATAIWLAVALVLLAGWMVETIEFYAHIPYDWRYGVYGSLTWTMEGWGLVAAAAAWIWGLVDLVWAAAGHFTRQRWTAVQVMKMFWTAQTVGWIFFWLVIYFGPRVFHKP